MKLLASMRLVLVLATFAATPLFAADATANAMPGDSVGASVTRLVGALFLVIALFLGGAWLFKNWQRIALRKAGGAKLNVFEVRSLGGRQALYVVGYEQQRMLIASSPAGVTMLTHLPEADSVESAVPQSSIDSVPARLPFAEALLKAVARR